LKYLVLLALISAAFAADVDGRATISWTLAQNDRQFVIVWLANDNETIAVIETKMGEDVSGITTKSINGKGVLVINGSDVVNGTVNRYIGSKVIPYSAEDASEIKKIISGWSPDNRSHVGYRMLPVLAREGG